MKYNKKGIYMKGKELYNKKIDKNNSEEIFFNEIKGVKQEIKGLRKSIARQQEKLKHFLESEKELDEMTVEQFTEKFITSKQK